MIVGWSDRHRPGPSRDASAGIHRPQITWALHELYEWYFPLPSSFELPPGQENEYLYIDEIRARYGHDACSHYAAIAQTHRHRVLFTILVAVCSANARRRCGTTAPSR